MRRHDMLLVSGIFLILSIIDFTLAAPVLVQEKRQACVDVVHIPRDVITILEERGGEEVEMLAEEYFKMGENPAESSDAHASSNSAPPRPDHDANESTNEVHAPASNPALPTANLQLLKDVLGSSSSASLIDSDEGGWWYEGDGDHEPQMGDVQQPDPGLSTDSDVEWNYYPVSEVHPPSTSAGSPSSQIPEWTDLELDLDHQSLSMDSQPEDPQAAINAEKGNAKELHSISGTAGDIGKGGPEGFGA
jgi:hypothetical protein